MNSGIKTNILIGLVSCLILVSSGLAVAEDAVIAKVGDVPITVYELEREMHRILPLNSSFHSSVSPEKAVEVRSLALDNLIDQAYKVRYARSQNISVEQSALEERLKTVYSTFKSEEELQKALGKESITAFRASVYRMLVAKKAEAAAVNSQADYSEEELQRLYKENSFMYQLPKSIGSAMFLSRSIRRWWAKSVICWWRKRKTLPKGLRMAKIFIIWPTTIPTKTVNSSVGTSVIFTAARR